MFFRDMIVKKMLRTSSFKRNSSCLSSWFNTTHSKK